MVWSADLLRYEDEIRSVEGPGTPMPIGYFDEMDQERRMTGWMLGCEDRLSV